MDLTDGHIVLRRPTESDAPVILEAVQATFAELHPWMPWVKSDYTEEDALQWIHKLVDPTAHPHIILDEREKFVGSAGLNKFDGQGLANLGYWLCTNETGRGIATQAANLLIAYGLDQLALERVEIVMSVENEASRRVAQRSDAQYEGIRPAELELHGRMHDVHVFAAKAPES